MIKGKLRNTDLYIEHDNGIDSVVPDRSVKESKVLIIDCDSLVHISGYSGKDDFGNRKPDYTEEEYPIAEGILSDHLYKIISNAEEYFQIDKCYICVKGNNNFRYELYPAYKANRPKPLPIIGHLTNYLVEHHNAIRAENGEADDLVFTISEMVDHNSIICSPDKDMRQIPTIIYDYQKDYWSRISEEEAKYNLAFQMIVSDSGDGVNLTPKHGKIYASKNLRLGMSNFSYLRQIIKVYKKCWGNDWKEKITLAYNLLKLRNINNLGIIEKAA